MEKKSSSSSSAGIGFIGVLTIAFIVLRLIGVIAWSWWWVLSPLWIGTGIVLLIIAVIFLVATIGIMRDRRKE